MRQFPIGRIIFIWFGLLSSVSAHDFKLPASLDELSLSDINGSVYVVHGRLALPDSDNLGFISNSGLVLTDKGIILFDSGGSYQVGKLIVERVRELTDKPIIAVFNSHIHGDHWLGNAAIRQAFPNVRIYAHQRAIERLNNGEAEYWQDIFKTMTDGAVGDTALVLPDRALNGNEQLSISGVSLNIHHTGHAHTDSDIMVELPKERLLFTGDIVEHGRAVSSDVPQDFSASGQIAAIKYALELPVDTFVPGHGVSGGREIPRASLRFLEILRQSVQRNYDAGLLDYEMRDDVTQNLAEFSDWSNMDQLGKLISYVYQEIEAEDFQ